MKRFDLEAEDCMGGWASRDVMNERVEGDWVRYEDAAARIAELEAAIDKLAAGKGRYHTEANYLALIAVRNKSLHK